MIDFLLKLKILVGLFGSVFSQWKTEVYSKDLDQPYCCDGRECGCYGMTVRQIYLDPPKFPE